MGKCQCDSRRECSSNLDDPFNLDFVAAALYKAV